MTDSPAGADSIETLQVLNTSGKLTSVARFFHPDSKAAHSIAAAGQVRDPATQTLFQVVKAADLDNPMKTDFYLFTAADLKKLNAALQGPAPAEYARHVAEAEFGPASRPMDDLERFQKNEAILAAEEFARRRQGVFANASRQLEAVLAGGKPQPSTYPPSLAIDRLLWHPERASVFTGKESQEIGRRQAIVGKIHDLLEAVEGEVTVRRAAPQDPTLSVILEIPRPVKEAESFVSGTVLKQVKLPPDMKLSWASTWRQQVVAAVIPPQELRAKRTRRSPLSGAKKTASSKKTLAPKKTSGGGGASGSASPATGSAIVAAGVEPVVPTSRGAEKSAAHRLLPLNTKWIM